MLSYIFSAVILGLTAFITLNDESQNITNVLVYITIAWSIWGFSLSSIALGLAFITRFLPKKSRDEMDKEVADKIETRSAKIKQAIAVYVLFPINLMVGIALVYNNYIWTATFYIVAVIFSRLAGLILTTAFKKS